MTTRKVRLAILYGGRSAEHQVSVVSARSVMEALDPERFEVVPIGITRDGSWMLPDTSPLELTAPEGALPEVEASGTAVALRPERRSSALTAMGGPSGGVGGAGSAVDVVFPILHGPYGEDGTVQGLFELADLPYVGSGVLASALAMDKAMAKVVFAQAGLPQAPYLVVHERAWRADPDRVAADVAGRFTFPVFVKPSRLGSSIGITKVKTADDLAPAMEAALAHDGKVLVEQAVPARELECGVTGNDAPEASLVGEVVPGNEFYDFEAKYQDESLKLLIPAPVPDGVAAQVRHLAVRAFQALGCEGLARVDFFYEEAADRVLLNEVNTIPGFTPKSMFPLLWKASGLSYSDLVARLVDLAVERHAAKKG
ncbi:MAG TPA: D-alanine--D-alanine ligase family protein [Actinomycetes bacterium]|jgi:D-alanine-D-alanine ligase|nr:D-alanine--D-alanine ligase family protein [Actinomycetes bacterium]